MRREATFGPSRRQGFIIPEMTSGGLRVRFQES